MIYKIAAHSDVGIVEENKSGLSTRENRADKP